MIQFTNSVGVAPGTTTMELGRSSLGCPPSASPRKCAACPPDPVRYYTMPPTVNTGWPSGITPTPTPGQTEMIYNPYGTESELRGLGDETTASDATIPATQVRLGVGITGALLGFAAVLGYGYWKRRKA